MDEASIDATVRGGGLLGWRDRLLASPRFQHFASRFFLTRPIARRRARELFDITAGFVYSQILFACVQTRLFEHLAGGPQSVAELSKTLDLPEDGALRLLKAAAALRLVQPRRGGLWGLGDLGAAMLGNPSIAAMVSHHDRLYSDLEQPLALLRGKKDTRLAGFWPYATGADGSSLPVSEVRAYSELMAASQALVASDILAACSLRGARQLLDVGGGHGAFATAAAQHSPDLAVGVFDLPAVAQAAGQHFADVGIAERAVAHGGDMFRDPLPTGADVISLVRILHDHDDEPVQGLLHSVRRALPDDGRLLIAEPMAGTPGAEAAGDAYFGFYLMAMGSGRPRRAEELREMLRVAGFSRARELSTRQPLLVRVLEARP